MPPEALRIQPKFVTWSCFLHTCCIAKDQLRKRETVNVLATIRLLGLDSSLHNGLIKTFHWFSGSHSHCCKCRDSCKFNIHCFIGPHNPIMSDPSKETADTSDERSSLDFACDKCSFTNTSKKGLEPRAWRINEGTPALWQMLCNLSYSCLLSEAHWE